MQSAVAVQLQAVWAGREASAVAPCSRSFKRVGGVARRRTEIGWVLWATSGALPGLGFGIVMELCVRTARLGQREADFSGPFIHSQL